MPKKKGASGGADKLLAKKPKHLPDEELNPLAKLLAALRHVQPLYEQSYPPPATSVWESKSSGVVVQRPNHALSNAARKAGIVPAIVRAYRIELAPAQLLDLQLAMLFESVGRESEISIHEDRDAYARFREVACTEFRKYAPDAIEAHAALHSMWHPAEPDFRRLSRVLEVAHDLELFRCHAYNGTLERPGMRKRVDQIATETSTSVASALALRALGALRFTGDRI